MPLEKWPRLLGGLQGAVGRHHGLGLGGARAGRAFRNA
jgi:hypothetical protein